MSYIGNQPLYQAFVTDQFNGDGSTVAFTMSVAPANTASVLVSVTGVLQDPSTYAVAGTTLTFSAAPPSGTGNISVRYLGIPAAGVTNTAYRTVTEFTATSGQTSFTVPSYTVGFINVYRNGVRLGEADFTATTGTTVVLASGATTGDLITTESFYVSSVLNAIPATAGAVNSTYITDGAVTRAKMGYAGAVLQVVQAYSDTVVTGSSNTWIDNPATVSITPTSTSSKILLLHHSSCWGGNGNDISFRFMRDTTPVGIATSGSYNAQATTTDTIYNGYGWETRNISMNFMDSPSTSSAITYSVQGQIVLGATTSSYFKWNATSNTSGLDSAHGISTIIAMEIAQ